MTAESQIFRLLLAANREDGAHGKTVRTVSSYLRMPHIEL
jgi:hypothetical protein